MKLEQNKAIARDYLNELVNKGNMAAFDTFFAEDVVFNGSGNFREQFSIGTTAVRRAFPDHQLTIKDQIAAGDKVVTRVRYTGTQQGAFQGMPATGKSVDVQLVDIFGFDGDGRVREHWGVLDQLTLLQQLGVVPAGAPV